VDTSSVCFADSFPSKGKPFGEHHQQLDKSEFTRLFIHAQRKSPGSKPGDLFVHFYHLSRFFDRMSNTTAASSTKPLTTL